MNGKRDSMMDWSTYTFIQGYRLSDHGLWVELDTFRAKSKWVYNAVTKYRELKNGKWDDIIIGDVPDEIYVIKLTVLDELRTKSQFLRDVLKIREPSSGARRSVDKPLQVTINGGAGLNFDGGMHVMTVRGIGDKLVREFTMVGYCDQSRELYAKLEDHPVVLDMYSDYIIGQPDQTHGEIGIAQEV